MLIYRSANVILTWASCISLFSVSANAAPPEALNKTLTVSFSHFTPAHCDNGTDNRVARNVSEEIYISTRGRVFARLSATAGGGRNSYSKEGLAEPTSSPFHFSGNKLIGTFVTVSGAMQQVISFDASYRSCTVEVMTGHESGKSFVWTNLAGVRCIGTGKGQTSNTSCSVTEGNSFAR